MKSIIEEASSISKAIENGWSKAGKPKEFSVKIFEEPTKNFFGLTIKSAKIGIFFEEEKSKEKNRKEEFKESNQSSKRIEPTKEVSKNSIITANLDRNIDQKVDRKFQKARSTQAIWSSQMINTINNWLNEIFEDICGQKIILNISADSFKLNININSAIFEDKNKEKKLFSSLAILIMQMLKKQYKRPFKGYRITFINNKS